MTNSNDSSSPYQKDSFFSRINKKFNLRMYFTGMIPLFLLAHFGHHGISAMMNPLMPYIYDDLGLVYEQAGYIMAAFSLTNGLSQLPAGMISDKVGVRVMILLGVTGVAVAGFFIGFTNSVTWLIAFLVLAALMGGGYHPAAAAAISSSVKPEYRGRALGIHLIGGTTAFWIFPLIATPIAMAFGWRIPYFVVTIPLMILGVVLYILIGRKQRSDEAKKLERIQNAEEEHIDVADVDKVESIQWNQIITFLIISVASGTVIQSASAYLALYATNVLGVSKEVAGMLTAIMPFVGLVGAPLGGYISDRFGAIKVIVVISLLSSPLLFFLGRAPNIPILIMLMIFMGLLMNTRMPTSESYLTSHTPEKKRGTIMGIYFFSGTGINAPLTPVVGRMLDSVNMGFAKTYSILAAVTGAIAVVCTLYLWRTNKFKKYPEITGKY